MKYNLVNVSYNWREFYIKALADNKKMNKRISTANNVRQLKNYMNKKIAVIIGAGSLILNWQIRDS